MYPLKMKPYYRAGEATPWGGTSLRDVFGKEIPDDRTGEALEVSALSGMESVVVNGEYAGKTFPEMLTLWGKGLSGIEENAVFPLLLKLLDAKGMLSVQVHPDDEYAGKRHGKLGKTEAWVILSAPADAKIVFGVEGDTPLAEAVAEGRLEESLHWEHVRPGDVLYIPHGMVHALGGGVIVYEIQQSSDVTYRFWDWGRVGKDGQPRQLHMEDALAVTRQDLVPKILHGATVLTKGGSATCYISDANFELWRLNVAGDMPIEGGRMRFLTPLGSCAVAWDDGEMRLMPGETVVIPAGMENVRVRGRLPILLSSLPDQQKVKDTFGYRAEEIAGLE